MKKNNKILITDSSSETRELLKSVLAADYQTVEAQNNSDALDILWNEYETICGVVLSIDMSDEISFEVLIEMQNDEKYNSIPIIVITKTREPDIELAALSLGASELLTKPINPEIARRRIVTVVEQRNVEAMRLENVRLHEQQMNRQDREKILETINCGVAMYEINEKDIKCVYFNETSCSLLGYKKEEYVPTLKDDFLANVCEEEREHFRSRIFKYVAVRESFDETVHAIRKDGSRAWVRMICRTFSEQTDKIVYLVTYIDVDEERRFSEQLRLKAERDRLTGIYNKERFYIRTAEMLSEYLNRRFILVRWNIERFKLINELFGQEKGDAILIKLAAIIRDNADDISTYGRLEADHFVMCCISGSKSINIIREAIDGLSSELNINHSLIADTGIYDIEDASLPVDLMCDRANMALQTVKGIYGERIAYYNNELRNTLILEQEIRDEMRSALENHEFEVYLQPIHNISLNAPVSAEALVRWINPRKGLIQPSNFIPLFEKNGFISELDYYVWDEVCHILKRRKDEGKPSVPISVNASRKSLYNPRLCDVICALTEEHGVKPSEFKIEITETAYTDNPTQLMKTITKLQQCGYPVLMDDFGSGYSSLNTLKEICVDTLKIDMNFLNGFENGGRVGTILTAILRMAKWLNIPVIAEGVETLEQVDFLRSLGCEAIQGFYFAKPMPYSDFDNYVGMAPIRRAEKAIAFNNEEIDALMGGNRLISRLIGSVFGGFGLYEMAGGILELVRMNNGYYEILGYNETTIGADSKDIFSKIYPDDLEKIKRACALAVETGQPIRETIRRYHHDGHLMLIDCIINYLSGESEYALLCIAFSDKTNETETSYQLRALMNNIDCGIALYELDGMLTTLFANDEYYRQNGYSPEELKGMDALNLVYTDDRPELIDKIMLMATDHTPIDHTYRSVRKDGTIRWTHLIATFYPSNISDKSVAIAVLADVSRLRETLSVLENVTEGLSSAIVMFEIGEQNRIVFSNSEFYTMMGYTKEQYQREITDLYDSIHHEDREGVRTYLNRIRESGATFSNEYRVVKRDGSVIYVRASLKQMEERNDIFTVLAVITDITEERANEREKELHRYSDILFGFYDEIYELDFYKKTSTIIASRLAPKSSIGKVLSLEESVNKWIDTYVIPEDKERLREFFRCAAEKMSDATKTIKYTILNDEDNEVPVSSTIFALDCDTALLCNMAVENGINA